MPEMEFGLDRARQEGIRQGMRKGKRQGCALGVNVPIGRAPALRFSPSSGGGAGIGVTQPVAFGGSKTQRVFLRCSGQEQRQQKIPPTRYWEQEDSQDQSRQGSQ